MRWVWVGFFLAAVSVAQVPVCRVIAPDATDGVVASAEHHTVLYENEDVRVIEVHSAPHTIEPMHSHARPAVMYVDSQGAGRLFTPEDLVGKSHPTDPKFKPRIFATQPETLHATENTGEVPFHALRVEFKHPGCSLTGSAMVAPGKDDELVAAPNDYSLLFENDDVRVLDVHHARHAKEAMHSDPWPGFLYVVEGGRLQYSTAAGKDSQVFELPSNPKIWPVKAEGAHSVEDVGSGPVHYVRFELKHAK